MKTEQLIDDWEEKYFDLVWYARKPPKGHPEWDTFAPDIRTGALNAMARVEEKYPDEVNALKGDTGDWEHGFNSGMLACLRLIRCAQNRLPITDEDGETYWIGGVEEAIEEFPLLDT